MQPSRRAIHAAILVAGVMVLYLGARGAGQCHHEWSLGRSHAVATAVAVEVTPRKVRGGCSTLVRFELKPAGSPETYETPHEWKYSAVLAGVFASVLAYLVWFRRRRPSNPQQQAG